MVEWYQRESPRKESTPNRLRQEEGASVQIGLLALRAVHHPTHPDVLLCNWFDAVYICDTKHLRVLVATESGSHGQLIFYYRKPVWAQIATVAMRNLGTFREIPLVTKTRDRIV